MMRTPQQAANLVCPIMSDSVTTTCCMTDRCMAWTPVPKSTHVGGSGSVQRGPEGKCALMRDI